MAGFVLFSIKFPRLLITEKFSLLVILLLFYICHVYILIWIFLLIHQCWQITLSPYMLSTFIIDRGYVCWFFIHNVSMIGLCVSLLCLVLEIQWYYSIKRIVVLWAECTFMYVSTESQPNTFIFISDRNWMIILYLLQLCKFLFIEVLHFRQWSDLLDVLV